MAGGGGAGGGGGTGHTGPAGSVPSGSRGRLRAGFIVEGESDDARDLSQQVFAALDVHERAGHELLGKARAAERTAEKEKGLAGVARFFTRR